MHSIAMAMSLHPGMWICYATLYGLIIGSFCNVLIYRLPIMSDPERRSANPRHRNLTRRSACPACGNPIRWRHNIPVFGWFLLSGHCHDCGEPISGRYPAIEFLSGLGTGLIAWLCGFTWIAGTAMLAFWACITATGIFYDTVNRYFAFLNGRPAGFD